MPKFSSYYSNTVIIIISSSWLLVLYLMANHVLLSASARVSAGLHLHQRAAQPTSSWLWWRPAMLGSSVFLRLQGGRYCPAYRHKLRRSVRLKNILLLIYSVNLLLHLSIHKQEKDVPDGQQVGFFKRPEAGWASTYKMVLLVHHHGNISSKYKQNEENKIL